MRQRNSSIELDKDWWKGPTIVEHLFKEFKQYILGLLLSSPSSRSPYEFFSGFLFGHRDHLFWMSAGHVIDKIENFLRGNSNKLIIRWFDFYPDENAGSIPINVKSIRMKSWSSINLDAGFIEIGFLEGLNILQNNSMKLLDVQICKNIDNAQPEGYYLIGFPRAYNNYSENPQSNNKILKSLGADYACIPLERIIIPNNDPNQEFFENPDAFYGQLLDKQLAPNNYIDNINYMSGSPIFSIERTQEDRLLYRLFGIQIKWLPMTRRICAEPITKIVKNLNFWVDENYPNE